LSILTTLQENGAVAIVRSHDQESGQAIADAIVDAGLTCIEVTLTNPGALAIIASLAKRPGVVVGVGTVLKPSEVLAARDAGATFIVSPNTDLAVIAATKAAGLLSLPGISTATEVGMALNAGADVLKLFPASTFGPSHLKALRDPFPGNLWCPTGGISVASIPEWFHAGAAFVGLGGPLTKGGFDAIGENVQAFRSAIAAVKQVKS